MDGVRKRRGDRQDARLVRKIDDFNKIFPFIMKGRNESAVYFTQQVRVEKTREFLRELNKKSEKTYTMFNLVLAAIVRTIALRPQMNRFIVGNRLYARDDIVITFVTKQGRSERAPEVVLRIKYDPNDTLIDITKKTAAQILQSRRENAELGTDKTIKLFLHLPRFVINGAVRLVLYLDRFGAAPKSILDIDPMRSSVFVSNLGNYDMQAPHHHLYEWGSSSIFVVMGNIHKSAIITDDDRIEIGEVIDFAYTIDERISDGYYFSTVIKTFGDLVENPEPLLSPPTELPVDE
ncbi:MAG: 2-oxo acid dehydrogenase subunit E2 [Clostridia bacterium]|nr:2-oxo acid dehydrogenase subunit E2 [Clostridia bacterium]